MYVKKKKMIWKNVGTSRCIIIWLYSAEATTSTVIYAGYSWPAPPCCWGQHNNLRTSSAYKEERKSPHILSHTFPIKLHGKTKDNHNEILYHIRIDKLICVHSYFRYNRKIRIINTRCYTYYILYFFGWRAHIRCA